MKLMAKLAGRISEELCDGIDYAQIALDHRVMGNANLANRYREMAQDEQKHAQYLFEELTEMVSKYKNLVSIPTDMEDLWEHTSHRYSEDSAKIKNILSL